MEIHQITERDELNKSNDKKVEIRHYIQKDFPLKDSKFQKVLFVCFGILLLAMIEICTRDFSKQITLKYFSTKDEGKNYLMNYYYFLSNLNVRYILLFLILTYVNIPAALCFIFLDCSALLVSGLMQLCYNDDRPFWIYTEYKPNECPINYATPSTCGVEMFVMFSTFYKAFTYSSKSKKWKFCILLFCFINIVYIFLIKLFQNTLYIHQLIYGMIIGYVIYYITFYIFKYEFENSKQFMNILYSTTPISLITFASWLIYTFIHFKIGPHIPEDKVLLNIKQNCSIKHPLSFDMDIYYKTTRIFEALGCLWGVGLEYIFIFGKNKELFSRYNIKSEEYMHSDTNWIISFIRLIVFFLIQRFILSFLILGELNIFKISNRSLIYQLVIEKIIPLLLHGILVFFVIKIVVSYLRLTNDSIWKEKVEEDKDLEDIPLIESQRLILPNLNN